MIDDTARRTLPPDDLGLAVLPSRAPDLRRHGQARLLHRQDEDERLPSAGQALYDAFNPEARKYYWNLMDKALFKIGADAWWLDTTEPETEDRETTFW